MPMPKLDFLDHVAIRVADLERSAQWYHKVMGLRRFQPEAWQPFPVMMLAGSSGLALFPEVDRPTSSQVKESFHMAFRCSLEDLQAFGAKLQRLEIAYTEEDHVLFKSIYFRDPDGYRLEITAEV